MSNRGFRSRVRILIVDKTIGSARIAIEKWIEPENSSKILDFKNRYVAILTVDTGGSPRFAHSIDCVPDMPALFEALESIQVIIEQMGSLFGLCEPGLQGTCISDVRILLNKADLAKVDEWFDNSAREFLRKTDSTIGRA